MWAVTSFIYNVLFIPLYSTVVVLKCLTNKVGLDWIRSRLPNLRLWIMYGAWKCKVRAGGQWIINYFSGRGFVTWTHFVATLARTQEPIQPFLVSPLLVEPLPKKEDTIVFHCFAFMTSFLYMINLQCGVYGKISSHKIISLTTEFGSLLLKPLDGDIAPLSQRVAAVLDMSEPF